MSGQHHFRLHFLGGVGEQKKEERHLAMKGMVWPSCLFSIVVKLSWMGI